jgi:hypothetical protein
MFLRRLVTGAAVAATLAVVAPESVGAQQTLATIRLPRAVSANGQPLVAGSYGVRVSSDPVTPVVGQPAGAERWVEFVQDGQVSGKELASVVTGSDVQAVVKGTPPASGTGRVQMLRGGEYLRVWINSGGTQYLIHLSVSP